MSEKKSDSHDEKLIDAFAELLDLDLLPQSVEEAKEVLRAANINIEELNKKSLSVLREISKEFTDDWRNVSIEEISSTAAKINRMPLDLSSSERDIKQRIQNLVKDITSQNQNALVATGLAWRNLDQQSKEDLARLLRKIEFIADELGIKSKKD